MSQMTATARPLRASRRGPTATPLRVMPTRFATTGNGAFATLCLVLLTVGLIGLLLLNTALAQGSLAVGNLQRESTALTNSAANLKAEIAAASAGGALAAAAAKLGMVRSNERAYIDLSTGKVSGKAYPATSLQALPIVTRPTPPPPLTGSDQQLLSTAAASVLGVVAPLGTNAVPKVDAKADPKVGAPATSKKAPATPKTPAATTKAPTTPRLATKPSAARGASSQTPAIG